MRASERATRRALASLFMAGSISSGRAAGTRRRIGFRAADALLRVRGPENRRAGGDSRHQVRLLHDRGGGPRGRRGDRRADRDQVPGAERRADEGRRGQVRRHARGGRRARRGDPQARDQRPHAARRPRRPQGRGQAGVLRERRLGRDREAAADAVQRHGRHRHRGGRRDPPRPRRPRPPLQPACRSPTSRPSRRSPRPA